MREREGLVARIRQVRRDAAAADTARRRPAMLSKDARERGLLDSGAQSVLEIDS